jgi:hypothetical protein
MGVGTPDPQSPAGLDYELWLRFYGVSAPAYIDQPQACFRWYEASKSGANFEAQFRENSLVAEKYAPGRRSLVWRNRLTGAAIAAVYRAMAFGRAGWRVLERR